MTERRTARQPVLAVRDLRVAFSRRARAGDGDGSVRAVDGVTIDIHEGETLGIVGESGCGKSTLVRTLAGLQSPTDGSVLYGGANLGSLDRRAYRQFRRDVQMVFQDPLESLNPRKIVRRTLAEPMTQHQVVERSRCRAAVIALLDQVGLSPADQFVGRYPHEMSGGQRQRVAIARALAAEPGVVLADEPVSSLDVTVQAQILALLHRLQAELGMTLVLVSHDLGVVRAICERVIVMYLGRIVEEGPTATVFDDPQHPYTATLLAARPIADPRARREPALAQRPAALATDRQPNRKESD